MTEVALRPTTAQQAAVVHNIWSRLKIWIAPLLVAAAPVVIGRIYPQTIFSPIGNIDFYMFTGLGLDYDLPQVYPSYYKVSRLPWILVEYIAHHTLPPIAAQYAIQHFAHILAALALYFAIRPLLGTASAFIGTLFLVTYSEFYSASPPDYMMAFSGALYLSTFWILSATASKPFSYRSWLWCGIIFALCLHTNFIFILFVPALIAHLILFRRQSGRTLDMGPIFGSVLVGGVAATLALGLVSMSFGRPFNFMQPQINYVREFINPEKQAWYQTWASGWWNLQEPYFGAFVALAVVSTVLGLWTLRKHGLRDTRANAQISLSLQYTYAFVLLVVLQTMGQAILEPNEMMYEILPPLGLAFCAMVSYLRSDVDDKLTPPVAITTWALIILPLCWPAAFTAIASAFAGISVFERGLISIAIPAAIVLASRLLRRWSAAVALIALALAIGICNVLATSRFAVRTIFVATSCPYRQDGYLAILDLNRWFRSIRPISSDFYIWVDDKETTAINGCGSVNLGDLGWSYRSLGLGAILTPARQLPNFLQDLSRRPDFIVLVASDEPSAAPRLVARFRAVGANVRTEPVNVREGDLMLNFVAIRSANAPG